MERKLVGTPLNFRGLVYSPINEQGVVYLFGLIANDLNMRVESIQQGYPDCTAIKFVGKGRWERINIEFEYKSSNFDHDPDKCDIIVCWEDDLSDAKKAELNGLEIIELKSTINTPEVPDIPLKDPDEVSAQKSEYDLDHHFELRSSIKEIQELYKELDDEIKGIDDAIWEKYSRTAITYYSPDRVFVYIEIRRDYIAVQIFTDQNEIDGIENIKNHENWGRMRIYNKNDLAIAVAAIRKSFDYINEALKNKKNVGWYALTPKDKLSNDDADEEDEAKS